MFPSVLVTRNPLAPRLDLDRLRAVLMSVKIILVFHDIIPLFPDTNRVFPGINRVFLDM